VLVFLDAMEKFIDVPPSYRQLEDLADYQIDYLISIMVGNGRHMPSGYGKIGILKP